MQSVTRISRNGSIISLNLQYRFKKDVQQLQNEDKYDSFENLCYSFFKKYPKAKSWLCWYLQPDRARIMFPACKDMRDEYEQHYLKLSKDTNAQESLGRDFKRHAPTPTMSVGDVISWTLRYCKSIERDRKMVLLGAPIKYGCFLRNPITLKKETKIYE